MYLVTWLGRTSGSYLGRDDGYPETKLALAEKERLHEYASEENVKFYEIHQVDVAHIVKDNINNDLLKKKKMKLMKTEALSKLTEAEKKVLGLK